MASFEIPGEALSNVEYIRLSPNGKYLAIANYWSPHIVIFNTIDGTKVLEREYFGVSDTSRVRFDPKDEFVAIADPFIVNGAVVEVVNLTNGNSQKVGFSATSGEEGFRDIEFFYLKGKRVLVTLSYNACRLSIWDMDNSYAEKKITNTCVDNIELADSEGNYMEGDHNSLNFFNIFTAQKVNTVINYYEHPQSPTYGNFFSYGFSNSNVIFLGDGPGLEGTFLRAIDYKTDQDIFKYDISKQGFSSLRVIKNAGKALLALIGREKISTVNLNKL
ncbi:MAG: hypothetical protein R2827_13390 [Bdellovibrionales bacterium]